MRFSLRLMGLLVVLAVAGCHKPKPSAPSSSGSSSSAVSENQIPVADAASAPDPGAPAVPPPTIEAVYAAAPTGAEKITLDQISGAIRQYVASHYMDPGKFSEKDLPKLVSEKYLSYLTPPPPGKKYVWNGALEVSLADR